MQKDPCRAIQSGVYVWSSLEKKLYAFYSFSSGKFNSTKSCWSSFGSSVSTTGSSYSSFSSRATSSTFWRPFCTTWTMRAVIKAGSDSCTLASSSCFFSGTAAKDSAVFSFFCESFEGNSNRCAIFLQRWAQLWCPVEQTVYSDHPYGHTSIHWNSCRPPHYCLPQNHHYRTSGTPVFK